MTNLRRIEEALAALTDIELRALIVASNEVPQIAPALLAWLEGACDWELNRRAGQDYDLQPPAIDPTEDQVSIDAAYVLRDSFCGSELEAGVRAFFDELIEILTGGGQKHQRQEGRGAASQCYIGSGRPDRISAHSWINLGARSYRLDAEHYPASVPALPPRLKELLR